MRCGTRGGGGGNRTRVQMPRPRDHYERRFRLIVGSPRSGTTRPGDRTPLRCSHRPAVMTGGWSLVMMPDPSVQAPEGGQATSGYAASAKSSSARISCPEQFYEMTGRTRLALSRSIDTCRSLITPVARPNGGGEDVCLSILSHCTIRRCITGPHRRVAPTVPILPVGWATHPRRRRASSRCASRWASRSARSRRLSTCVLPLASPSSSLARPSRQ